MQRIQKGLWMGVIICTIMIGTGYAYADTNAYSQGASSGLNAGLSLSISGWSALPGLALSLFTVYNKNIMGTGTGVNGKEVINPRKLFINILVGMVISTVLSIIGIDTKTIQANNVFLTQIATMAVTYMFLHWSNLAIRPLFAHLVTFLGSTEKALGKP
jgi:hypothetical protein